MNCVRCKKRMTAHDRVLPVYTVMENDRRGDFFTQTHYVHLKCIPEVTVG